MTKFVTPPNVTALAFTVIEGDPASVHVVPVSVESSNLLESLLAMVTGNPSLGAPPWKMQDAVTSRCCPTVTAPHEIPEALTVAITLLPEAGVLKPAGATAVRVVVPVLVASGLNCTVAEPSPPLNTAGAGTGPTAGLELVTGTETVNSPLRLAKAYFPLASHCWISEGSVNMALQVMLPCASSKGPLMGSL